MNPTERRALTRLLGAVGLWGLGFPLGKALAVAVEAATSRPFGFLESALSGTFRYLLAGCFLLLFVREARGLPSKGELLQGALMGGVLTFGTTATQWGVGLSRAATAAFLTQLYLVFVVGFVVVARRRLPSPMLGLAVGSSLAGCAALAGLGGGSLGYDPGVPPLLVGALLGAVQILLLDVSKFRENRPEPVTLAMFVVMGTAPLVLSPLPGSVSILRSIALDPATMGLTFVLASLVTALPFLAMTRYQPQTSPVRASMLYTLEPVVSSVAALFLPGLLSALLGIGYPNEGATPKLIAGGALILFGNLVLSRSGEAQAA